MKITDAFLGEHGVFYAQFDWIEEALPLASGECVGHMAGVLAAALGPHARLEDELLFGPMEDALGPGAGPSAVMRMEHEDIERNLDAASRESDPGVGRALLHDAIRAARDHFAKEEEAAFPMAEELLGAERLRALGREWAAARRVALT